MLWMGKRRPSEVTTHGPAQGASDTAAEADVAKQKLEIRLNMPPKGAISPRIWQGNIL